MDHFVSSVFDLAEKFSSFDLTDAQLAVFSALVLLAPGKCAVRGRVTKWREFLPGKGSAAQADTVFANCSATYDT